ncbi:MAG: CocE/NonD family hydrolase, partial [Comamonadaceae bacterium]
MTTPHSFTRRSLLRRTAASVALAASVGPMLAACDTQDGVSAGELPKPDWFGANPTPTPQHEVTLEPDLRVRMRDGVELATDIYRPVGVTGALPTILIRTQYGKSPYRPPEFKKTQPGIFAGQGYTVVVQELRGLFNSGGSYALGEHDATDGYDTLTWIASQPWSNGRVGTYGCSSLGINQVLLAPLRHPAHTCAIAGGSGG